MASVSSAAGDAPTRVKTSALTGPLYTTTDTGRSSSSSSGALFIAGRCCQSARPFGMSKTAWTSPARPHLCTLSSLAGSAVGVVRRATSEEPSGAGDEPPSVEHARTGITRISGMAIRPPTALTRPPLAKRASGVLAGLGLIARSSQAVDATPWCAHRTDATPARVAVLLRLLNRAGVGNGP